MGCTLCSNKLIFIVKNIKDDTKPRIEYEAVEETLDSVLDAVVRYCSKEFIEEAHNVRYIILFNFLAVAKVIV